jgi:hypothetical protein
VSDQDDITAMLHDLEIRSEKLTDWELKFVDDMQKNITKRPPSKRQAEVIQKIWERVT